MAHNQPNPFSDITEINYSIPIATKVKVSVFSASGEEVAVLVNCLQKPGYYSISWNRKDNNGKVCPNGINKKDAISELTLIVSQADRKIAEKHLIKKQI
ncbi:MAG: hypothetical protein N2748_05300 [candidate division WOR-3 bacterium]|nr:hypothetical protein [candidate division WOR-3 bacterium]